MVPDNAFELSDIDKVTLLMIMIKERNNNISKASFCRLRTKLGKQTGHFHNVRLLDEMYESHQFLYIYFLKFGRLPTTSQIMGNQNSVAGDQTGDLKFLDLWKELFNDSEIPTNVRVNKKVFTGIGSHEYTLNIWKPEKGKPSHSGSCSTRSLASEGTLTQRFHPYGIVDRDKQKVNILKRIESLGVPVSLTGNITKKLTENVDILDWIATTTYLHLLTWMSCELNCAEMNNFVENWKKR